MSRYNTSTNHPLIPNANEYLLEERVVSIHSEDRDAVKWPNPAFFEIELPNEFMNVNSVKLGNYTIPVNFNAFSVSRGNVSFTFRLTAPYNPADFPTTPEPPNLSLNDCHIQYPPGQPHQRVSRHHHRGILPSQSTGHRAHQPHECSSHQIDYAVAVFKPCLARRIYPAGRLYPVCRRVQPSDTVPLFWKQLRQLYIDE